MPPIQDDDDLTPDEREYLRGGAPAADKGDDEPAEEVKAEEKPADVEAKAEEDKPAEEAAAEEDAPKVEEPAAQSEPEAEAAPAQVQYETLTKEQIAEQKKTLRTEKAAAFKKFSAGEMSEDDYLAVESKVDDALEDLTTQATLIVANEQSVRKAQVSKLESIKAQAKKDGTVDYEQPDAADEFNAALQALYAAKSNAGKSFDELADRAHQMVLALRGVAPKAAAPAPEPAPAPVAKPKEPPKPRDVPQTLSGLPSAAAAPVGDDTMSQFAGLDAEQAEAMLDSMPKNKRESLLRSTIKH